MKMEWLQVFNILGLILVCVGINSELATTTSPEQKPTYLISVPKVLRCGVPLTLSVTVLTDHALNVTSELIHGDKSVARIQSTVPGGSTEMLNLPPVFYSKFSFWYQYELHVKGFVGSSQVFSNSTTMIFSPKCVSIFIQTDKNRYQPGQVVKFRVVSLNLDGKPYKGQIDIFIQDPRGNMIRQWLSVNPVMGAVSEELVLSQNPSQGQWSIMAQIDETVQTREFNVEHYVLPKFEVQVDVPSVHYFKDTLVGTVNAKYFYGKPVSGVMNVSYVHYFHGLTMQYQQEGWIEGSADFTFEVPDMSRSFFEHIFPYSERIDEEYIDVNVNVTERAAGLTYNNSARVSIVRNKYNIEFLQQPQVIKPAMTFSSQLKVSTFTGEPLTDEERRGGVRLVFTQYEISPWMWYIKENAEPRTLNSTFDPSFPPYSNPPAQEMMCNISADGIVVFPIRISDNMTTVNIEAQFKDAVAHLQMYSMVSSSSESYIKLHTSSDAQVGKPLSVTVESNVNLTRIHYVVMSRGRVVKAGTSEALFFSLHPDPSWTPLACILVYYTLPDGEIVNGALQVTFKQVLANTVSLSWSQNRSEPGNSVSLSVSVSESKSLVGILVVDKATLDSKTDNGITVKKVLEEFMSYSREMTYYSNKIMGDPYSTFMTCGVTVLTDAKLNQERNMMDFELPGEIYMNHQSDQILQETRERKFFPETWIWMDADMGNSTSKSFPFTVPDSMTSYVAFAIVMSENLGLGISDPVEMTVFQDFFLSLNLPAFIIRGELLLLEVNLFNYLDMDLEVIVVIAESPMFEFVSPDGEEYPMANVRKVYVSSQNITTALFPIRATVLGEIAFSVKASSIYTSDLVYKTVLVKSEGMEQSSTQTLFLEFPLNQRILSRTMEFVFPADVVPGSQRASVSAVGDILGPSISNLDSLIQMPYGCGEQNMIHFAPNIYVLQYLRSSGHQDEQTRSRAMSYMMEAYERELSYQRIDGSFSAFGDSDPSGSTWLSAFVLRCFLQARAFFPIDPSVIQRTALWLVSQQNQDGSFREPGYVIHTELQGGLDGPVSLTAYVLMALLEDDEYRSSFEERVSSARSYLSAQLSQGISSNYSLCLITYALSLANSSEASSALTQLLNRAIIRDGVPSWSSPASLLSGYRQPSSSDIEMSAYVLLSMNKQTRMDEGFKLMKWLSQQRNHLGGYGSTQDTVMALHALSVYARYGSSEFLDLSISVNNLNGPVANFIINKTNYLLQQSQDLTMEAEDKVNIDVVATGQGFALFQLNVFYNINGMRTSRKRRDVYTDDVFYLFVDVLDDGAFHLNLHICFSLRSDKGLNQTGMAILDVGLLTGLSLNLNAIQTDAVVRRVETPPGRVILYLNTVTTVEKCVEIPTIMDFKVAHVQDAVVIIYDYYEPQRKTVRSYTSAKRRDVSVCSLCGSECPQCQNQDLWPTGGTPSFNKHHLLTLSFTALLLVLLSIHN